MRTIIVVMLLLVASAPSQRTDPCAHLLDRAAEMVEDKHRRIWLGKDSRVVEVDLIVEYLVCKERSRP